MQVSVKVIRVNIFNYSFKGAHLKNKWHDYRYIVGTFDIFCLRNIVFDFFHSKLLFSGKKSNFLMYTEFIDRNILNPYMNLLSDARQRWPGINFLSP